MSTNLVIVAIPEEQDRVWKLSSEKVPHLTLLFLGDAANNPHVSQIMQFVEHATTLSEHGPFYLDVDHRGVLGADEADVLFFNKRSWNLKWIKQFRGQLLQNEQIKTAHDSVAQYEEWHPHLTLGYPATPANPIPDDGFSHPIYSVTFDRIAVWTGNYEGPDFRLEWPEREYESDMAVAWSSMNQARVAAGLEALEHFGIKGMKWGVSKEQVKSGFRKIGSGLSRAADALGEHFYETSIYSDAKHEAIHNQVADEIDSKLFRLQTAPKYRGKSLKADKALKDEYDQDVAKVTDAAYRRAVKDHIGENAKGTKEARYIDDARGPRIEIRDKKSGEVRRQADLRSVQEITTNRLDTSPAGAGSGTSQFGRGTRHAAIDIPDKNAVAPDITIPVKLDDNGQIKAVGRVKPSTTATHGEVFVEGLMHGDVMLEHYGIKGMRWGVRQNRGAAVVEGLRRKGAPPPVPVAPEAHSVVPHGSKRKTKIQTDGGQNHPATEDAIKVAKARIKLKKSGPSTLTNQELRDVAERMRLEQQVVEMNRGGTSKFIRKLFKDQGSQAVNEVVREGVKESRAQVKDSFKK